MKKIIINENWEEEIIEDTSSFFVIIFKQGTNSGYIKAYSISNEEILAIYNELITAYESTGFNLPAKLYVVKLPATGQVKAMLEQALYNGEENNTTQIEIINHLLGRADCEYIGESNIGMLTEAKKKKKKRKKRKTPRVTYTTGWPWYNDHMFNHHMGSCDCNKDKDDAGEDAADSANDAIGGGESVGDASSGEGLGSGDFGGGDTGAGDTGGAMGESLVKESMFPDSLTRLIDKYDLEVEWRGRGSSKDQNKYFINIPPKDPRRKEVWKALDELNPVTASLLKTGISFVLDSESVLENLTEAVDYWDQIPKMKALNDGTRGFNAKAASDEKLKVNRKVCIDYNYTKALAIVEAEMRARGILPQPTTTPTYKHVFDIQITADEIQPADVYFILDNKNNIDIITDGATTSTAKQTFHNLFLYLGIALYLKELNIMNKIKDFILATYDIKAAELKQLLLDKLVNDKAIHDRILSCIETAIEERK